MSFVRSRSLYQGLIDNEDDETLLNLELATDDPEGLEGYTQKLPADFKQADITLKYEMPKITGTNDDYSWCAYCQKKTHRKGYVLKSNSGAVFAIGKVCGKKLYGVDWQNTERRFTDLRRLQLSVSRLHACRHSLQLLVGELRELKRSGVVHVFEETLNRLWDGAPDLMRGLRKTLHARGGMLLVRRHIRDWSKEQQRADRHEDELKSLDERHRFREITTSAWKTERTQLKAEHELEKKAAIYTLQQRPIGHFPIRELLDWRKVDSAALDKLIAAVSSLVAFLGDQPLSSLSPTVLRGKVKELEAVRDQSEALRQRLASFERFFEFETLKLVATWASKSNDCSGSYSAQKSTLIASDDYGDFRVELPPHYSVPDLFSIDALRNALGSRQAPSHSSIFPPPAC